MAMPLGWWSQESNTQVPGPGGARGPEAAPGGWLLAWGLVVTFEGLCWVSGQGRGHPCARSPVVSPCVWLSTMTWAQKHSPDCHPCGPPPLGSVASVAASYSGSNPEPLLTLLLLSCPWTLVSSPAGSFCCVFPDLSAAAQVRCHPGTLLPRYTAAQVRCRPGTLPPSSSHGHVLAELPAASQLVSLLCPS